MEDGMKKGERKKGSKKGRKEEERNIPPPFSTPA